MSSHQEIRNPQIVDINFFKIKFFVINFYLKLDGIRRVNKFPIRTNASYRRTNLFYI